MAELLGWFGAGLSCVISLPQVVRTMRAKQLDGISSATYWLVLANAAAWTAWSLLTGEYAAGVPALVNGPVAIVILHRLLATRHTARRNEFDTEVRESPHARFTDTLRTSYGPRRPNSAHLNGQPWTPAISLSRSTTVEARSGGQGVASSNLASPTKPIHPIRPSRTCIQPTFVPPSITPSDGRSGPGWANWQ